MQTTRRQRYLGISAFLLFTCLAVPGSQAGVVATVDTVAASATLATPPRERDEPQAREQRLQRLAMADTRTSDALNRAFLAPEEPRRYGNARGNAEARANEDMGLELPEPGPLSAIVATITLAAFLLIRRTF